MKTLYQGLEQPQIYSYEAPNNLKYAQKLYSILFNQTFEVNFF